MGGSVVIPLLTSVVVCGWGRQAAHAAPQYQIADLRAYLPRKPGPVDVGETRWIYPGGINAGGQVVYGLWDTVRPRDPRNAWIFDSGSLLPTDINLGTYGWVGGINAAGHLAGWYPTQRDLEYRAFMWDGQRLTDLGTLGNRESRANAINDGDRVVGYCSGWDDVGNQVDKRAFVYEAGRIRELAPLLGGTESTAAAVNVHGQIVGSAQTQEGAWHAFLYSEGQATDLGTLGGETSAAHDINDRAQVVGSSETADGETRPFIWSAETGMVDLGVLPGCEGGTAHAINGSGWVIGSCSVPADDSRQSPKPFLYDGEALHDFHALLAPDASAWSIGALTDINDSGCVVGRATETGASRFPLYSGFLGTPTSATAPPTPPPTPELKVPDRRIAYSVKRGDNDQIRVTALDGSVDMPLTDPSTSSRAPDWSPDGERLVFCSERDGNAEIYVMDADGGNQTRLTDNDAQDDNPAWSPDGAHIAFDSDRDGNQEIYAMGADGSNPVRLTNHEENDSDPDWSPNGQWIVFVRRVRSGSDLCVVGLDGRVSVLKTKDANRQPAWSPDGNWIAFSMALNHDPFSARIYVIAVTGGDPVCLHSELEGFPMQCYTPVWSSDGNAIAYAELRGQAGVRGLFTIARTGPPTSVPGTRSASPSGISWWEPPR